MACSERERRYKFPLLSTEDAIDASRAMFGAHFMLNEEDLKRPQVIFLTFVLFRCKPC